MISINNSDGTLNAEAVQRVLASLQIDVANLKSDSALGNPYGDSVSRSTSLPKVSGLTTSRLPLGGYNLSWNRPSLTNLQRFEVFIDTDAAFSNPTIVPVTGLEYSWLRGSVDTNYYNKVRLVTREGVEGPFSNVIASEPGLVGTDNIEVGSVLNIEEEAIATFSPSILVGDANGETATYGNLQITTVGRPTSLDIFSVFNVRYKYTSGTNRLVFEALRNGSVYRTVINDLTSVNTNTSTGTITLPLRIPNDTPDAGINTYQVRITVTNSNGPTNNILEVTPVLLVITAEEKRV